eukprot:3330252-Prymnesium_polylepis.1
MEEAFVSAEVVSRAVRLSAAAADAEAAGLLSDAFEAEVTVVIETASADDGCGYSEEVQRGVWTRLRLH